MTQNRIVGPQNGFLFMAFALLSAVGLVASAQPGAKEGPNDRLARKSLDESVAEAQVILVGTALDAAPAPPKAKGDAPEHLIRYRVVRVIKGELTDRFVFVRT